MQTNNTRSLNLPAPIAGYFANEASDPQAVAQWFTNDGLVVDERQEHRGRAAIAAWNAAAAAKYSFSTELLATEADGGRTMVRGKVTGNFPASPIALCFRFTLEGNLIARLEIAP